MNLTHAKYTKWLIFLSLLLLVSPAFAAITNLDFSNTNAQTMVLNFAKSIPNLMRLITALAYVMGMYFIFLGVLKLKMFGEQRTMMSSEQSLKGPLVLLVVGTLLLYLPSSVQVGLSTFWTDPNPYAYLEEQDQWSSFINVCFLVIQLVGTIAFIRGLLILTQLGGHAQPGVLAKGMTHIIGGVMCINIYGFIQMVLITLGIQS